METKTYLPALPDLIEIDMESLHAVGSDEQQGGDPLEELQMRAELAAIKERQKNKMLRHRQTEWF